MERQITKYRIRNFGNDRDYEDVDELIHGLRNHYAGDSVAIHIRNRRGMLMCMFVDVTDQGEILESYPQGTVAARVSREMIECVTE